jgi:hypothetical protein
MEHLSSTHLGTHALDDTVVRYWTCALYADSVDALMDRVQNEMERVAHAFTPINEEDADRVAALTDARDAFFGTIRQELAQHAASVKQSAKKFQRRFGELAEEESGFVPRIDVVEQLVRLFNNCTRVVDFFRQLSSKVDAKLKGDGETRNPDLARDLEKILLESEAQILRLGEEPAWTGARAFMESLESAASELAEQTFTGEEIEPIESRVSPRVLRGDAIKQQYILNAKLEKEAKDLGQELASLALALKKRVGLW